MAFVGRLSTVLQGFVVGTLLLALFAIPLHAQEQKNSAIAQGFQTDETNIAVGALMSLKDDSGNTVELANSSNAESLIGIIGDKPLIELSSDNTTVQVVTSGTALALVSDLAGDIQSGDKITASPIDGVGVKTSGSATIVGTAQADLSSAKITQRTITDADGKNHTVRIGSVPILVNVTYYAAPDERTSFLPPFLQNIANALAGHEVSAVRVIIAAVILLLALISIAVLLYSSVQSSIISIGRNPLSEGAVRKGLFQVGATIMGILLLTVIAIYLILRL